MRNFNIVPAEEAEAAAHCNPNGLEKLDYLSTNDSGNDDRSKWAIRCNIIFYQSLRNY